MFLSISVQSSSSSCLHSLNSNPTCTPQGWRQHPHGRGKKSTDVSQQLKLQSICFFNTFLIFTDETIIAKYDSRLINWDEEFPPLPSAVAVEVSSPQPPTRAVREVSAPTPPPSVRAVEEAPTPAPRRHIPQTPRPRANPPSARIPLLPPPRQSQLPDIVSLDGKL